MSDQIPNNNYDELIQIFEDLQHQIKSPITQAHIRSQIALRDGESVEQFREQMRAIRGLCGKARQITMRIGLFVCLTRGNPIQLNTKVLAHDDLMKMLLETTDDNQVMIEPARQIRYSIDRDSFDSLKSCEFVADQHLLEQVVRSILDNAGKYSYPNSVVSVRGGLTQTNDFYISIANQGIPIHPYQIERCVQRGWRSEEAKSTTGEGSGLGLWIVNNIMRAHGGELKIAPTTAEGITDIRLIFRCKKVE
jgi:two-component system, OmpR family, heavy metal sensor histidine kinase CusS